MKQVIYCFAWWLFIWVLHEAAKIPCFARVIHRSGASIPPIAWLTFPLWIFKQWHTYICECNGMQDLGISLTHICRVSDRYSTPKNSIQALNHHDGGSSVYAVLISNEPRWFIKFCVWLRRIHRIIWSTEQEIKYIHWPAAGTDRYQKDTCSILLRCKTANNLVQWKLFYSSLY